MGNKTLSLPISTTRRGYTKWRILHRAGADERALRAFTEAFRTVVRVDEDEAAKLELASLTKDFSNFLVGRFGDGDAVRWWRSFAKNPLASKREQQIAAQEAQRVETKK